MAAVQFLGLEMSKNSLLMEKHCREYSSDKWPPSHTVQKGNKYHTRKGISHAVYNTTIRLYRLVTCTHDLEFKITLLFPALNLPTLHLCFFILTALFPANSPFRPIPLLLQPSSKEGPSLETTILALSLQFRGTTKPFLHFIGTLGEGTGQTTLFLTTDH